MSTYRIIKQFVLTPISILFALMAISSSSYAKNNKDSYVDFNDFKSKIDAAIGQSPEIKHQNKLNSATLSSQELNINGPLQISTTFSDQYGITLNSTYSGLFNSNNAFAIEGDLGVKENRINLTLGHAFSSKSRIKFTAEGLSQNQTFNFASGDINQWVFQFAGGSEFQQLFGQGFLNNMAIGGYYSNALSRSLDTLLYKDQEGQYWVNYRHIAGATSTGGHLSLGLRPWKTGIFTLTGYYDAVNYNIIYDNVTDFDSSQMGYGAKWDQYLGKALKTSLTYSHRALYDTFQAVIQLFWNVRHDTAAMGLMLSGTHNTYPTPIIDNNDGNSNENIVSVGLQYYFTPIKNTYTLPTFSINSLSSWTEEPAVRMAKVLAVADQKIESAKLNWENQLSYHAVDETTEKISWSNNATSNVPNAAIHYELYVKPVDQSTDPNFSYDADVTGLAETNISNLKTGTMYKATLMVSEQQTGQRLTASKTFKTDSSEFPWDPSFSESNVTTNSLTLAWKAPERSVPTDTMNYEVIITNQSDATDTQTLKKQNDATAKGGTINLPVSGLTSGQTYKISITAENAHGDTYDITKTDYTCQTNKDSHPAGENFKVTAQEATSLVFNWQSPERYENEKITYSLTLKNDNTKEEHTYPNIRSDTAPKVSESFDTSSDSSYTLTPNTPYTATLTVSTKSPYATYTPQNTSSKTVLGDITWNEGSVNVEQSQANKTVTITWPTAKAGDSSDGVTYTLKKMDSYGTTTPIADNLTDTNYNVSDLDVGKTYTFHVLASHENYNDSSDKASNPITVYSNMEWSDGAIHLDIVNSYTKNGYLYDTYSIGWNAAKPSNVNDAMYYDYKIEACSKLTSTSPENCSVEKSGTTTATTIDNYTAVNIWDSGYAYEGTKVTVTAHDDHDYNQTQSAEHRD